MSRIEKSIKGICRPMVLVAALIFALSTSAKGATIRAASPALADVTAAIALAAEGDTVTVPAGTGSWASSLTITKAITLQGQTSVTGDHTKGLAADDNTIIVDNVARTSANNGGALVKVILSSTKAFRLTGFTFQSGNVTTASNSASLVFTGTCPSVRIDHCHTNMLYSRALLFDNWLYGVVDHCLLDIRGKGTALVCHPAWNNKASGWGSWADPPYFGTEKFIFFEDDHIINHSTSPNGASIDCSKGGRYVIRYCKIQNTGLFNHGSDSGSGGVYLRGSRAIENYNNTYDSNIPGQPGGQLRGGTLLYHHNTLTGTFEGAIVLKIYRQSENDQGWGGVASGTAPWDCNATEADGTHVDGHPPRIFYSGTHIGGNNSTTVTVSGTPWKINQWAGYSVLNTDSSSAHYQGGNLIISNTSNTLTLGSGTAAWAPYPKFNTGDTFQISKVLVVLDQPGRGKSDLIVGSPAGSTGLTGTKWPAWPHNALEPCYSWSNTLKGATVNIHSDPDQNILREGVDYHANTPMPGYTPYTYPHPLVSGLLSAPTNLRVVNQ